MGIEVIGGDNALVRGWGVAGPKGDGIGGGMSKGTALEDDVEGVDDIRTTGKDGVWGRCELERLLCNSG